MVLVQQSFRVAVSNLSCWLQTHVCVCLFLQGLKRERQTAAADAAEKKAKVSTVE